MLPKILKALIVVLTLAVHVGRRPSEAGFPCRHRVAPVNYPVLCSSRVPREPCKIMRKINTTIEIHRAIAHHHAQTNKTILTVPITLTISLTTAYYPLTDLIELLLSQKCERYFGPS